MSDNQIQEYRVNRLAISFADSVESAIMKSTNHLDTAEARRLTLALYMAAHSNLEEQGINWNSVDINKFAVDAIRIVTLGLDASNSEAYAIPYKNNKTNRIDVQCKASAWGIAKLVKQYAIGKPIEDIKYFIIKEGDDFQVVRTPKDDIWEYRENLFGSGNTIGYVTIIAYTDGTSTVMTHSKADIEKRRKASKAPNSLAWTKWYDEMAIAKAIRRHCGKIAYKLPYTLEEAFKDVEKSEDIDEQIIEMKDVTDAEANKQPLSHPPVVPEAVEDISPVTQEEAVTEAPETEEEYQKAMMEYAEQQMDFGDWA